MGGRGDILLPSNHFSFYTSFQNLKLHNICYCTMPMHVHYSWRRLCGVQWLHTLWTWPNIIAKSPKPQTSLSWDEERIITTSDEEPEIRVHHKGKECKVINTIPSLMLYSEKWLKITNESDYHFPNIIVSHPHPQRLGFCLEWKNTQSTDSGNNGWWSKWDCVTNQNMHWSQTVSKTHWWMFIRHLNCILYGCCLRRDHLLSIIWHLANGKYANNHRTHNLILQGKKSKAVSWWWGGQSASESQ